MSTINIRNKSFFEQLQWPEVSYCVGIGSMYIVFFQILKSEDSLVYHALCLVQIDYLTFARDLLMVNTSI